MNRGTKLPVAAAFVLGAATLCTSRANADQPLAATNQLSVVAQVLLAQAMVPPTGLNDAQNPMPMDERMNRRFPQPVRVRDLLGLPVLDDYDSTLGFVQQVVRTPQGKINLIVSYSSWFGWFGRPVAVPIEAVAILGRQLASLDMPPSEYAAAPTWQGTGATVVPSDATIRVALGRR
ncbi:MAG TPA: PRC-barrel domain-containing protein [Xanthobacteraceae bacterium]